MAILTTDLHNYLEDYIEEMQIKGLTNKTLKNYEFAISAFIKYIETEKKNILEIDKTNLKRIIKDYKKYRKNVLNNKNSSINNYLIQIMAFLNNYDVKTALYEFNKVINCPDGFYDTIHESFTSEFKPLSIPKPTAVMPSFEEIQNHFYNMIGNNFICSECGKFEERKIPINHQALSYLTALSVLSPSEVRKLNIDKNGFEQIKQIVFFIIQNNIDSKLNSIETGIGIL